MARPRKVRLEGEAVETVAKDPVPGDNGAALLRIVDYFKAMHPDKWEAQRLCPLQHGLEDMAEALRG